MVEFTPLLYYSRFNVASPTDPNETLTPPPKEFKRMNSQRKTMRAARCMSTIVTEKERALLVKKQVGYRVKQLRETQNLGVI